MTSLARLTNPSGRLPVSSGLMHPKRWFHCLGAALGLIALTASAQQTNVAVVVRHAPSLNGNGLIEGSVQQLLGENVTINGGFTTTGDFLVPGTPSIRVNGKPSFSGTVPGSGSTSPSGYQVMLNGNCSLNYLRTRTAPVALPTVAAPPRPSGSRNITISSAGQSIGDAATLRDLTLNGDVGQFLIPPGTYGNFIANGGSGLTLGIAGAINPSVYNLQNLTLNGQSRIDLAGPVILTVANGFTGNGLVGSTNHPAWLQLQIASGGFTLNGGCTVHGSVTAPAGTVIINGNSLLVGMVQCDRLTLNSGGIVRAGIAVNQVPLAGNQSVSVPEDGNLSVTLTGSDPEGSILTYTVLGLPSHGSLAGSPPNLIYRPGTNYNGTDSFTFKVNDGQADSAMATVSISVTPVNDLPTAQAQVLSTPEDSDLNVTLSGADVESSALTFEVVSAPAHGTLSGTPPALIYTPTPNYSGLDSFSYTANDGQALSDAATVSITVVPVDDVPVANAQTLSADEDTTAVITLTALDVEGDGLVYAVLTQPAHGTLTGTPPELIYTPATNYHGTDSFTFAASDAWADSAPATVTLAILPVNDLPVANAATLVISEDAATNLVLSASDVDGDSLSFQLLSSPSNGLVSGSAPELVFSPAADFHGTTSFSFVAVDGSSTSAPVTITFVVTPVNDVPIAEAQAVTLNEDTPQAITLRGTDVDGNGLTYTVTVQPANGTLSGAGQDLVYTPDANFAGTDTFAYQVNDGATNSVPALVTLTIQPVNDAPSAIGQDLSINEDSALNIVLAGNDVENDSLIFSVLTQPANGTLSGIPPELTYTPNANYHGADSFTFTAHDGNTNSAPATISISVISVNDVPVAASQTLETDEEVPVNITLAGSDIDQDSLTYSIEVSPAHGTLAGVAPNLTYTPGSGYYGPDAFTFKASDGTAASDAATVSITVRRINRAPIVSAGMDQTNSSLQTQLSGAITDDGLPNGADVVLAWSKVSGPGTVTFSDASASNSLVSFSESGIYVLRLTANDSKLESSDEILIVANAGPIVDAGPDQTFEISQPLVLHGWVSDDGLPFGQLSAVWQVTGPGPVVFTNMNELENTVSVSGPGTYVFTLIATDFLSTNSDETIVTVTPVNFAPMVAIGPKQLVFLPESATLLAFVRDDGLPMGSSLAFQWTKVSGPGEVTFADPASTNTTASFSAPGDYVLRLSASDSALTGFGDLSVAVRNPAMNQPPIVSAGGSLVIGLTNIASLRGAATDDGLPLGSTLNFQWSVVSGPAPVNFAEPGATNTSVAFQVVGTYVLRLMASDSQLAASNDVTVTVHPFNQPPLVMAGEDQTVTVPDPVLLSSKTGEPLDPRVALQTSLGSEPRWNHTVGQPGLTGPVDEKALSYSDGILYAGGKFGTVPGLPDYWNGDLIRRWDGTNWSGLYSSEPIYPGGPPYGYLTAYRTADVRLVARGKEVFVDTWHIRDINENTFAETAARWDGAAWCSWQVQIVSPAKIVGDLVASPDLVYLAGYMSFRPTNWAGGIDLFPELPQYETIATWDGTNWGTVGSNGLPGQALSMALSPDYRKLYVGGFFHYPTPTGVATNIVMWDGNQWAPLGGGLMRASTDIYHQPIDATQVRTLAVDADGMLYAAGSITVADGNIPVRNVARWDGTNWSAMGSGFDSDVFTLAVRGRDVFAGGMFSAADGKPARRIARWNGFEWRPLRSGNTNGVNGLVWSLETAPEGVYVAGAFTEAGGSPVNYISLWEYPTEPQKGVQLTGQVVDDGLPNGQLSVHWSKVSGPGTPTFVNSNSAVTSVTFDQVGTYVLRLSANDSEFTTLDEVTITLQGNQPPVVNAGSDQIQGLSESVVLQGCVADDGLPVGDNLMWSWSVVNGPGKVTFGNQSITNTTVRFSQTGIYILRLTANDMQFTVHDEVRIVVTGDNQVPGAHPGSSRTVLFGASTNLSPALLRDDGLPIQVTNVLWSQISGPGIVSFGNPTNPITPVSFSLPGVYVVRLNVNDSELTTFMDTTWTVTLGQSAGPTIEAGPNQSLTNLSVLLTGSVTDDGLPADAPLTIWWSKSSGPGTVSFVDSNSPVTWATFSKAGMYVLQLFASDTTVTRYDHVVFQMPNQTPLVNAGPDRTIGQPAMSLSLAGSATDDGQFYAISPSWAKVSGPGTATFSPANALNTTVTFSAAGTYVLRLSAWDGGLVNGTDEVAVVVAPSGNQPPTVTAGTDLASTWPATNLTLSGSVTDDGLPAGTVETTWTQVSGPASAAFSDPSVSSPQVAFPAPGTYTLRLMASDSVLTNGDDVVVQILPPANLPPVVSIGSGQVLQLPETLELAANVSDDGWPAGGSVQWFWRKISGPGPVYFPGSTNLTTNLNPTAQFTVPGDYVLRFTASDSASSTSADLNVTVLPSDPNQRPVVFAGPDQVATQYSPFTLAGNITDDGLPTNGFASVAWSKLSGPGNIYFGNAAALNTTAAFYLPGTYVLRLTASDGRATGFDDLSITVVQPVNEPPLADAGPDLQITRPEPAALEGAVYDDRLPAGYPLSYEWTVVSGPGTVTFVGGSGTADYIFLNTLAYFSTNGTYVLRLTAGDSEFTHSDEVTITVLAGINFAPIVHAGPDFAASLTSPAVLHTEVTDDGLESGILQVSWSQVSGPGAAHFSTVNGVYQATFNTAGDYTLRLTAHDGSLTNFDDVTISVMDATSPVAEISRPIDGSTITAPADIIGTAQSPILKDYVVEYRLAPDTDVADVESAEAPWSVLASNSVSVTSNALAVFDPTLLLNGIYELRLTATDVVGRSTTSEPISVIVDRNLKIGHFTISFNDLTLPVPGLPIQVTRTYDSRAAAAGLQGDFGLGWTLDIKNVRLQKNRSLSRNWTQTTTGDPYNLSLAYHLDGGKPRIVTVTFPEGRVEKFQFVPDPMDQALVPIEYPQWRFIPMGNTRGTLVPASYDDPDGHFLYFAGSIPGTADLYDLNHFSDWLFGGGPIEELQRYPTSFRYSNPEGYHYLIDEIAGLQSVTDPNGNTLLIGTNGVSWTNSVSGGTNSLTVAFQRDEQGRITNIVDAAGNALRYSYNTAGDLAAFTDRSGNTNGFAYTNAAFPHHLTGITDARGVMPIQNQYDESGRLVSNVDAFGNRIGYGHDLANNREYITNQLGQVTANEYDEHGNVNHTIDPLGGETWSAYDDNGNLLESVDQLGRTNRFTYDSEDNRLTATDPLGNTTCFSYGPRGRVLSVTDALGHSITNDFDANGNLLSMTDPLGNVTRFGYDKQGLPVAMTNAAGQVMRFEYDSYGRLAREVDASGHATDYERDSNGNLLLQTTTRTRNSGTGPVTETLAVHFYYDAQGRLTNSVSPDGSSAQTIYNAIGKPAVTIDQQGRQTITEYDDLGRVTRTIYPDGTSDSSGYDAEGRRTSSTNRVGQVTSYFYDALGRLYTTVYPDGTSSTNYFDAAGQLLASTDARGNSTFYGYDATGRSVAVTNALGQVSRTFYDAGGNLTNLVDALGRSTAFVYDALNRRVETRFADGSIQSTFYDVLGRRVAETDQATNTTWFGYDDLGRLTSVTNALGFVTRYTYDELGQQITQTDANNHTTTFEYDSLGRRVKRTLPGGQVESYGYSVGGLLTNKTDFNGHATTYQYDLMNRLLAKVPDARLGEPAVTYGYNVLGLRTNMTDAAGSTAYSYDGRNRLVQKTRSYAGSSFSSTLSYGYDELGNLTNILSSDPNGVDVSYGYDALNRLNVVRDAKVGATVCTYDEAGNLKDYTYPNFVSTAYRYDSLNRLTNLSSDRLLTTPLATYGYTVGASGNRLTAVETLHASALNAHPSTINRVYTYDNLYRVTGESFTFNSQPSTLNYAYDPVGNRLSRTVAGAPLQPQSFGFDANDRLNSDSYDANGNTLFGQGFGQSQADRYDSENRLVQRVATLNSQPSTIHCTYDGDGDRVSKTVTTATNTVTTYYVVDDLNPTGYSQVLEEHVSFNLQPATLNCIYTYGHTLISQDRLEGTIWRTSFYGFDGHNNVRYLTDIDGRVTDTYDYDAYGNLISRTGTTPNNYLFSGQQFDPDLGLYYLRARYHNPDTGRFWTQDSYEGTGSDPSSLHKYTYCGNNPVNAWDPSGNFSIAEMGHVGMIGGLSTALVGSISRGVGAASAGAGWRGSLDAANQGIGDDFMSGFVGGALGYGAGSAAFWVVGKTAPYLLPYTPTFVMAFNRTSAQLSRAWLAAESAWARLETAIVQGSETAMNSAATALLQARTTIATLAEKADTLAIKLGWRTASAKGTASLVPESYMNSRLLVNMEPARNLVGSTLNAGGEVRNASYFWQQLIGREPQMFSRGNLYRVQELGLSPRVDATWVKYNPTHQRFMNDVLAHHHIDQGPIAVPLPQTVHQQWTSVLHGN